MERRHEDMINKYGLDNSNIGWYLVSYKQSLWEQLEIVKYYEVISGLFCRSLSIPVLCWSMIMRQVKWEDPHTESIV